MKENKQHLHAIDLTIYEFLEVKFTLLASMMARSSPSPSPLSAGPRHSGRRIKRRITRLAFSSTLSPVDINTLNFVPLTLGGTFNRIRNCFDFFHTCKSKYTIKMQKIIRKKLCLLYILFTFNNTTAGY